MNFLNNIFGSSSIKEIENLESTVENTKDIDETLFVDSLPPVKESEVQIDSDILIEFNKLINRDHYKKGYKDGYDYQDVELISRNNTLLISEAVDLLIFELRKIDKKLIELKRFENLPQEINSTLKLEIEKMISKCELDKQFLEDKLNSTEEASGAIKRALINYETGFTRGFVDRNASINIY